MRGVAGEAHLEWFDGNFEDYAVDKRRRLGLGTAEPND